LSTGAVVGVVVGAVLLLFGVVAVVSNLGDDRSNGDDSSATVETTELRETAPVTVTGAALPELPDSGRDAAVGQTPPTLTGVSFDGTPVEVDPTDGQAKMLVFLAHWCPHCRAEVPRIVDWVANGGKPEDLELIAIATGTSPDADNYPPSAWLEREKWPGEVLVDSAASDALRSYGASAFPNIVIIGADGKVKARHSGEFKDGELQSFVADALAE